MNAAIAGVCERAERIGGEACGIQGGFEGLAERRAVPHDRRRGASARGRGGHLARHEPLEGNSRPRPGATRASRRSRRSASTRLVVIGGHGSALGARVLADAIPVAFIPATIDQDVEGTGATIGMHSAIGLALETIEQLRVTGRSLPGRAFLLQTLGAPNGYLADAVASAAGIDLVLVPERPVDLDAVAAALARAGTGRHRHRRDVRGGRAMRSASARTSPAAPASACIPRSSATHSARPARRSATSRWRARPRASRSTSSPRAAPAS